MVVSRKFTVCAVLLIACVAMVSAAVHEVLKGETYYSISRQYGISVDELQAANGLTSSDVLKTGQKLIIPEKGTTSATQQAASAPATKEHVVAKGDTLYSIARNNGTTVDEIRALNSFTEATVLKIGQVVLVPSSGTASSAGATAATSSGTTTGATTTTTTVTTTVTATATASVDLTTQSDPRTYETGKKGDTSLIWPVKATEVIYISGKISGVALTSAAKEAVKAIHSGTVMFSGVYRGFGKVVFVQDTSGFIYVYAGLDSVAVSKGDSVTYQMKLGEAGTDALSGKAQINLMVYQNGRIIDPAVAPRG